MAYDLVAILAIHDFFERHKSEMAGKYVDTLFVMYRPHNNEIFFSIWYSLPLYETMNATVMPDRYTLTSSDEISFEIPILKQFPELNDENYQPWIDFNILQYNFCCRPRL